MILWHKLSNALCKNDCMPKRTGVNFDFARTQIDSFKIHRADETFLIFNLTRGNNFL